MEQESKEENTDGVSRKRRLLSMRGEILPRYVGTYAYIKREKKKMKMNNHSIIILSCKGKKGGKKKKKKMMASLSFYFSNSEYSMDVIRYM